MQYEGLGESQDPLFSDSHGKPPAYFTGPVTLVTFGAEQYVWPPEGAKSHADPDGPRVTKTSTVKSDEAFLLPRASVTVLRGRIDRAGAFVALGSAILRGQVLRIADCREKCWPERFGLQPLSEDEDTGVNWS